MKTYFVLCFTFFLALTVDARKRHRPRNLSQCRRVIMSQGRGARDCSVHNASIMDDLATIHQRDGEYMRVFGRWAADRARALDPNTDFQSLVASGACTRMMCFKTMVERYVRQPNYDVPQFCRDQDGRQYRVDSALLSPTSAWGAGHMRTVFCAKAYDPNFKFH